MKKIRVALETHLRNTPNIPAVVSGNIAYDPAVLTTYIKANLVPLTRRPAVRGTNPQKRIDGLYSLLICTSQNQGTGPAETIVDTLLERFDATTDLEYDGTYVSVDYAEASLSYNDGDFYCTPVNIKWYSYEP